MIAEREAILINVFNWNPACHLYLTSLKSWLLRIYKIVTQMLYTICSLGLGTWLTPTLLCK